MSDSVAKGGEDKFCTTFKEFSNPGPRSWLRSKVVSLLEKGQSLQHCYEELSRRSRIQFLCLHHLFPDEEEDFKELLNYIRKTHVFLSYGEAVDRLRNGVIDRPSMVLSFDDGFASGVRAGEILNDLGISACFFICPSIIDSRNTSSIKRYCRNRLGVRPVAFMNRRDLLRLKELGHEIGYHSWSHPRLSKLDPSHFERELDHGLQTLSDWVGEVEHFAWPFGKFRDISKEALDYLMNSHFRSLASAERGCYLQGGDMVKKPSIILRDPWVAGWPLSHLRFFLCRNVLRAKSAS